MKKIYLYNEETSFISAKEKTTIYIVPWCVICTATHLNHQKRIFRSGGYVEVNPDYPIK